jgi:predicted MFS family arabinose efflux permease
MVGVAAHATSSLKPLIIQAFVHSAGFDKATSGYLLTAEMISTSLGSIVATALPFALRRRKYLFAALGLMMLANLASIPFRADAGVILYALRCLSGLGAGFGLGRLGILIALSGFPGRTAGIYSITTQLYGAAAAFSMPWINRTFGASSIFVILAGTVPLALIVMAWVPEDRHQPATKHVINSDPGQALRRFEKVILAASFFVFFVGIGNFWPFISVLAETADVSQIQMSTILGWGSIVSAIGSGTSILAGDRKSSVPVLTLFLIAVCASVGMQLAFPRSFGVFVASALLFAFAYYVISPMFLGVLSKLDRTGQMNGVFYIVAVGGIAIGPALAGWILAHQPDRFLSATILRSVSISLLGCSASVQTYYFFRARRLPD